jgi:hypothetical protein
MIGIIRKAIVVTKAATKQKSLSLWLSKLEKSSKKNY